MAAANGAPGQGPAPTSRAVWLQEVGSRLEVGPAPVTAPRADEIVVANRAVAVNPVDRVLQGIGSTIFRWIDSPFVLGSDLAGEVVAVGSAVTRFAVGDRVLGHAVGADKARNTSAEGAFQERTVVLERLACPLPDGLSYEEAAVLPLALSTAACGLFQRDHLALAHPSAHPEPTGRTVLVWGGSTSVGANAIQLAVAAGYDVVTTASARNAATVTALGASRVVDHHRPDAVREMVSTLRGATMAGALAIGPGSARACADVVRTRQGRRFVSVVTPPGAFETLPVGRLGLARSLSHAVAATAYLAARTRFQGVATASVFGSSLLGDEVAEAIYRDFLPDALAEGRYTTAPPPLVVGTGLERVQEALDTQRRGVSARKVVVLL